MKSILFLMSLFFVWQTQASEYTPVVLNDLIPETNAKTRPWSSPDYTNQESTLGYGERTFAIPLGLERKVQFWIDIYAKYSTDQGVLHDSENIDIIYEVLDFTHLSERTDLTAYQKERKRQKIVKKAKARVKKRLRALAKVKDPSQLDEEDLKVWNMFKDVSEKNKFNRATSRYRLRFQLGQSDRFRLGIYYSGRYLPRMEEIFKKANLPRELLRVVFVESSFNVQARSRVGASGIWQIMRGTARPYMRVNKLIDERNDPIKATEVAAKILRQNYRMLKSWPLALTGYNHGPAGMRRLVKKYKNSDLVYLVHNAKKSRFGFASKNFYAAFLAALEVEKRADKYLGAVRWSIPFDQERLRLKKAIPFKKLISWYSGDEEQTKRFNPHINRRVRKGYRLIPRKTRIYLPKEKIEIAKKDLQSYKPKIDAELKFYRVSRGDTLSHIAERHRVSVKKIILVNNILRPNSLSVGQEIRIPAE